MNRPAIPTVNDRRAFTFTEIINEGFRSAVAIDSPGGHGDGANATCGLALIFAG